MEKQFTPYFKWFGTAFNQLNCADGLHPIIQRILCSQNLDERERALSEAYVHMMEMHNALRLTPEIEPRISSFHNRPYQVPHSSRFVDSLEEAIKSEQVKGLPGYIGGVNQSMDSTDILSNPQISRKFKAFFE